MRASSLLALVLAAACTSDASTAAEQPPPQVGPSGPTVPVPATLWQPPPGSTPATGSYAYVDMDPGFTLGVTYPRVMSAASTAFTVSATGGRLTVTAVDTVAKLTVNGVFQAMIGQTELKVGYYRDLRGSTEADPLAGSLDVLLGARGCASLVGWFAIDHVFYFNGLLTQIDVRFEERCAGFGVPMHGQIHWRE